MMSMSSRLLTLVAVAGVVCAVGCTDPGQRLNAPPQGASERPNENQDSYVYMHDNAMLAEMSMSPAHFVPHRSDPNGVGLRRLMRYVDLLKQYGGALHYDGIEEPEALAKERVERIRAFLVEAGVDPNSFSVEVGVGGGQGLRATEASEIRTSSTFSKHQQEREEKGISWEDKIINKTD